MGIFQNIMIQAGFGFVVFALTIIFFNLLTKGFLLAYIGVKASRGKKVLMRIHSITGRYYRGANITGATTISFKTRDKKKKIETNLNKNFVWDELGVKGVDYDEQSCQFVEQTEFKPVPASDPNETDNLLTRAMTGAQLMDKKEIVIIVLCVLNIIASGVVIYLIFNLEKVIKGLKLVGVV